MLRARSAPLTALLLALAAPAAAQTTTPAPAAPAVRAAAPADVASLDAIVAALYASISGPKGAPRDFDRLRTLFGPNARLIPTGMGQDGKPRLRNWSVEEYIAAAPGEGCWHNDARCRVSTTARIDEATVLVTDDRNFPSAERRAGWDLLSQRAAISRGWGDCYGYLLVATGRADVMVAPILNPWDAPPFLPIIEEAGGVFTGWTGHRDAFAGDAIATNRALADAARALLWSADAAR